MADLVESVLREAAKKESKYKTTEVNKDIELYIDKGNLLATDSNPLDLKVFRSSKEQYLKNLARDNTQLLINSIWDLPTERVESTVVAQLPEPKTLVPREKHIPKEKALTKWEQYAQIKGIQKKKKTRMVWDEPTQAYKPKWGYKRSNDSTQDWAIEVKDGQDPFEDQFAKRTTAKKERVAKNELQRLRNIARSQGKKVRGVGLAPIENPSTDYLRQALAVAKKSTASVGKFTENLHKEKPSKLGNKRKFEPNHGNIKQEMTRQLDILNDLNSNRPIVDANKAAIMHKTQWESARAKRRREDPDLGKKKKAGKRSNMGKFGNMRNFKGGNFKSGKMGGKSKGGRGRGGKQRGGKM